MALKDSRTVVYMDTFVASSTYKASEIDFARKEYPVHVRNRKKCIIEIAACTKPDRVIAVCNKHRVPLRVFERIAGWDPSFIAALKKKDRYNPNAIVRTR